MNSYVVTFWQKSEFKKYTTPWLSGFYLQDSNIFTISACLTLKEDHSAIEAAFSNGVMPDAFGALGFSVNGARIFTISGKPLNAAHQIGVSPK